MLFHLLNVKNEKKKKCDKESYLNSLPHFYFKVGSKNYVGLIFEPLARRSQLI